MQGVHNAIRMVHARVMQVNARAMNIMPGAGSATVMERVHVTAVNVHVTDMTLVALVNVTLILRVLVTRPNVHAMGMLRQLVLVIPLVNV